MEPTRVRLFSIANCSLEQKGQVGIDRQLSMADVVCGMEWPIADRWSIPFVVTHATLVGCELWRVFCEVDTVYCVLVLQSPIVAMSTGTISYWRILLSLVRQPTLLDSRLYGILSVENCQDTGQTEFRSFPNFSSTGVQHTADKILRILVKKQHTKVVYVEGVWALYGIWCTIPVLYFFLTQNSNEYCTLYSVQNWILYSVYATLPNIQYGWLAYSEYYVLLCAYSV